MKTMNSVAVLLFCSCCFALAAGGCGKKETEYGRVSSSMKPEGQILTSSGSSADRQEDFSAGEMESLDSTGTGFPAVDATSAEYKAVYGRSTAPLYPVFFDFDSSTIQADQQENLNSSASHLLDNRGVKVIVEGNCDERGTAEYNLALGQLRALNVKKYLVNLGVDENRMTTVSYGAERPLNPGHDEFSWAMNRRADLVMP